MNISVHLCGTVVAYEPGGGQTKKRLVTVDETRPQGSLINQQKRSIANAVEWMRLYSRHKPLIFVATSPGFTSLADEKPLIQKFTHNLRNGYGLKDYVWVREHTKMGYPHFHFVASIPFIKDVRGLSLYWSGLFDSDSTSSVRLGSKPRPGCKRLFYIQSQKHAYYLSKYIGKDIDHIDRNWLNEDGHFNLLKKNYRSFQISQQVALMSQPITYTSNFHFSESTNFVLNAQGLQVAEPVRCIGRTFEDDAGRIFHPNSMKWKQHPIHKVWFGCKKPLEQELKFS